jgi:transposase
VGTEDVRNKSTRTNLIQRFSDADLQAHIATDLDVINALDPVITDLEENILVHAKQHHPRDFALLLSIPGVGKIIAFDILYEIHTIRRFKTAQKLSSYSRVVKCQRTSAGKVKGAKNQKIGNPYLKWAMSQIIISAQQSSELIRTYYHRLESKYGKRKARAQIAHKFAVAIYYMLKNGQGFDEKRFVQA